MMKKIVEQNKSCSIFRVDSEYLRKIAEFVVKANYSHHTGGVYPENISDEIDAVYQEEKKFASTSQLYIAENSDGKMIGCIRVAKWDLVNELPIKRIFNIDPLERINNIEPTSSVWHVGRFAVDSHAGISTISLFKQLMIYAITPICKEVGSYMVAECDCKLLRVMELLEIETIRLGDGIHYLGSETIPVYATREGLLNFFHRFRTAGNSENNYKSVMNVA